MKELNKNRKVAISLALAAIIVLSTFVVSIQYGLITFDSNNQGDGVYSFTKIFVDDKEGLVPHSVNFTAMTLHYTGNIEYSWDFGDGETSKEMNPVHIYKENGTYVCKLTVTDDGGETGTDSVKISASENQSPQVTIELSDNKISRPWKPGTLLLWSKLWDYYEGRYVRPLIDKTSIPFVIMGGYADLECNAQVYDPEGDEIVSYKWELQPPTYTTGILTGSKQAKPVYVFEGKTIKIPLAYVYMVSQKEYIIKVTVTDSAGNNASDSKQFKVEDSPEEVIVKGYRQSINGLKVQWLLKWSKTAAISAVVYSALSIVFEGLPDWPLLKILTLFALQIQLNIDNRDLGVVSIVDLLGQFLKKHPKLLDAVDSGLVGVQNVLEKNSGKLPGEFVNNTVDSIELVREALGSANKRPTLSNPVPEDNTKNVNPNCPHVSINVEDYEGDPFNVTISGEYINNITFVNQYNGTFNATLNIPLPEITDIIWHVEVIDPRGKVVQGEYKFKTFIEV